MKKNVILPAVALIGGAVGLGLRKWGLVTAFEPGTGLPVSGAPATLVLFTWTALVVIALVLLSRNVTENRPFDTAFYAEGQTLYLTAAVLSGFLLLAGGGAELVTGPMALGGSPYGEPMGLSRFSGLLLPLRVALSVVGFACVLMVAKNLFRATGKGRDSLPLLGLCLFLCVWLISDYQSCAADPIFTHYVWGLFAILAGLLGMYFLAGFSFQTGRPRLTVVLCLLGVYLSLVTLADRHSLAELLRYGFLVLFLTAHTALLLREHSAGGVPTETEDHHA